MQAPHRWAPVLAALFVLLSLPTPGEAATGNARSPDLQVPGKVLDLAMSDAGFLVAAADDPGSSVQGNATLATWFLWDAKGTLLRSGHADHPSCGSTMGSVRPPDVCKSPTVGAAISRDGRRFAFASRVVAAAVPTDTARGMLVLGTAGAGETLRLPVDFTPVAIALSADGATLAAAGTQAPLGGAARGMVRLYAWPSDTTLVPIANATTGLPVSDVALSSDGQVAVVGAEKAYRVTRSGAVSTVAGTSGNITAVSVTDVPPQLAVAISATGDFALATGNQSAGAARIGRTLASVAALPDGSIFLVGDASGSLLRLRHDSDGRLRTEILSLGDPSKVIGAVAASRDQRTAAAISGVDLVQVSLGTSLALLWRDAGASSPAATGSRTPLAIDGQGETVAGAKGSTVRVETARHRVVLGQASLAFEGNSTRTVAVAVRNDGNREESGPLLVAAPAGWGASVEPANYTLLPDRSAAVQLTLRPPAVAAPGTYPLRISGGRLSATLNITVAHIVKMVPEPRGATSLGISAGSSALFTVRIANRGNAPESARVEVPVRPSGWLAKAEPATVMLSPGKAADVNVFVTAPASAVLGDQGNVTLRVAGASLNLLATVGARFSPVLEAPGGVSIPPGNSTTLEVHVLNDGNAVDGAQLRIVDSTVPRDWRVAWSNGAGTIDLRGIPPGQRGSTALTIWAPGSAPPEATATLLIQGNSLGDPAQTMEHTLYLSVGKPGTAATTAPAEEGPGLGAAFALVALGLAAAWTRRR